jgi:large subunit ribosomal protein L21
MFAVIKNGGKQYKVFLNQELEVDYNDLEIGAHFEIKDVLMIGGENVTLNPQKSVVKCEVLGHKRGKKLIVFKNRPRSTFRKKTGHRQDLTVIKIKEILSN